MYFFHAVFFATLIVNVEDDLGLHSRDEATAGVWEIILIIATLPRPVTCFRQRMPKPLTTFSDLGLYCSLSLSVFVSGAQQVVESFRRAFLSKRCTDGGLVNCSSSYPEDRRSRAHSCPRVLGCCHRSYLVQVQRRALSQHHQIFP